jgi:flagellar basal body-associated protein FliL
MGKFDDIDLSDEMETRDASAPKKGAPALVWVFVIIILGLAAGTAVLGYYAMNLSKRIDGLETEKQTMEADMAKASQASKAEDGKLADRLRAVEARLPGIDERIGEVAEGLETFRKEIKVAQAEADQKLAAVKEQLELKESNLTQLIGQVRTDLDRTKQDAEIQRKTYATQVGQVNEDFEYIKEELGKKAEKAYLKFLKRDLTKKIDGIAKDVVTVRADLEDKLTQTEQRVAKKFDELDTKVEVTVEKKVEKATAMDFVPTEEE